MSEIRKYIDDGVVETSTRNSAVKPYVLSHGTLECADMAATRRFYEDFLGLECVQHGTTSMAFRCGLKFHVVCIQAGDKSRPCHLHNHWGLDVTSEAEVNDAYRAALDQKDKYGIKEMMSPEHRHGVYSFYLEDRDSNWWEIQYYPDFQHDDMFEFGDRFTADGKPVTGGAE
ncbi:VOC family protein [Caballeronia sp. J97]|uniref:VOC family protein n=1 Tax=Caballeronia sp. J97 TaxID=2805429 RepID=UPI002AB2D270|nr:VOC family protein [Caballeronia sp. J97]